MAVTATAATTKMARTNGRAAVTMVTVNLSNATIGDLILFEKWQNGDNSATELIEFLDRVVDSDVPVAEMPLTQLQPIMQAITADLNSGGGGFDPKD